MRKAKLSLKHQVRSRMSRNILSSLILHGEVKTTLPKAKFLKAEAERFVSRLKKADALAKTKLCNETLYGPAIKKAQIEDYGKIGVYKMGNRFGDNAPVAKVILEINKMADSDKKTTDKKSEASSGKKKTRGVK